MHAGGHVSCMHMPTEVMSKDGRWLHLAPQPAKKTVHHVVEFDSWCYSKRHFTGKSGGKVLTGRPARFRAVHRALTDVTDHSPLTQQRGAEALKALTAVLQCAGPMALNACRASESLGMSGSAARRQKQLESLAPHSAPVRRLHALAAWRPAAARVPRRARSTGHRLRKRPHLRAALCCRLCSADQGTPCAPAGALLHRPRACPAARLGGTALLRRGRCRRRRHGVRARSCPGASQALPPRRRRLPRLCGAPGHAAAAQPGLLRRCAGRGGPAARVPAPPRRSLGSAAARSAAQQHRGSRGRGKRAAHGRPAKWGSVGRRALTALVSTATRGAGACASSRAGARATGGRPHGQGWGPRQGGRARARRPGAVRSSRGRGGGRRLAGGSVPERRRGALGVGQHFGNLSNSGSFAGGGGGSGGAHDRPEA